MLTMMAIRTRTVTITDMALTESGQMAELALLRLMYLVSPALPIGAYAYSQGQEYAVDSGWIHDAETLCDWLGGLLRTGLAQLDLPLLARSYRAWCSADDDAITHWNNALRANRETHELLFEDEQLGLALGRILATHGITRQALLAKPSYVSVFALAGAEWHIPLDSLMQGFVWSWLENQVAAGSKTIPLGQTQAQHIFAKLTPEIPELCRRALTLEDEDIGAGLPGLALASCLHERQYSRLFRS